MQTLAEMLSSAARMAGDRPYIISDAGPTTFAAFDRAACRLANVLAAHGVGKGEAVGLFLPNRPILCVGYYACQKVGAIPTSLNVMNRAAEVASIVARTDMRVLIANPETFVHAKAVRDDTGAPAALLVTGGAPPGGTDLDAAMAAAPDSFDDVPCWPDDVAALFFTSGTTGAPKGAMQTQRSQCTTLRDMMVYNRFRWGREVLLDVLPCFNNFGATCLMNMAIYAGSTMIMLERWDTDVVLDAIARHGATFIAGTPTMFVYLLRAYDPARHDLSSIRLGVTGGAPVSPTIIAQFQDRLGAPLVQIYGATETTGYITGEPVIGPRRRGSAGLPIGASDIEIVDDGGAVLPPGQTGEVRISGDAVGAGYWRDPETTAKAFTPRGWLSGDLGVLDEDGYLTIVDRKKDVIICGGANIYPLEVEDVLYTHPDIAVCAVVGAPDDTKGEIPVLVAIPKDGRAVDGAGLIAFCRERLSVFKAPRRVYTVDEMPLGPSGKILKRRLREMVAAGDLRDVS